jgi:flagellar hook-basal body complex protein FliE
MAIGPIDGSFPLLRPQGITAPLTPAEGIASGLEAPPEVSFAQVFGDVVASANAQGHAAHKAYVALAEGRSDDIHGTMIEGQKASIEMRLVGTIKNKIVDAFYEIWRMNI